MKENLYYLFISGVLLGSGPCLSLCAPILVAYTTTHKASLKKSIFSYIIFSLCKLTSYTILGIFCALGVKILHNPIFIKYLNFTNFILGYFIVIIGISVIFYKGKKTAKICQWVHKGNIKNVGVLGILIGFTPCLPLLGILNYILLISHTIFEAVIFSFTFGLGTIFSPLLFFVMLSAKLANRLSQNNTLKLIIRITCGMIILFLGGKIILQRFPR